MVATQLRPYRPAGGITLHGPFLTAAQVGRRLGRPPSRSRQMLLAIASPIGVGLAYPEFQFGEGGQILAVALLAPVLVRRIGHEAACDWLTRPNPILDGATPIAWIEADRDVHRVIAALPEASRRLPGGDEAEVLELELRRPWRPEPYQAPRAA